MDDSKRAYLEVEASRGDRAQLSYDGFIGPFIDKKTAELFDVFKDLPTTETDKLVAVKMQTNALESLRDEIQEIINTGKLASKAINDEGEDNE